MSASSDSRPAPSAGASFLRLVLAAALSAGVLVLLHVVVSPSPLERNLEFAPQMFRSPAVESQSLAPELPGGVSELPLVDGVVPRGTRRLVYAPTPQGAERAGRELANPFGADDENALARGARVYAVHCAVCHGADGAGRGTAVERGLPPPPSLAGAAARSAADGTLFHLITLGRGNMPGLQARMEPDDRWRAVLHVRRLQREKTQ